MRPTQKLMDALQRLAYMQNPSVAGILRSRGFAYEAHIVEEVLEAWEGTKKQYVHPRPKTPPRVQ